MEFGLAGKKALVGGASKGLGLATARALAEEGCDVAIVGRSAQNLEHALGTFGGSQKVKGIQADLGTSDGLSTCFDQADRWGRIDILVNNTGGPPPGGSFDHDEQTWQHAYESLLLYVKKACEHFVPAMRSAGWGRVITITSRTVKEPAAQLVLSNVFRSGVTAYLKVLAREVAPDGVTVNSVLPGAFLTERYEELLEIMASRSGKTREAMAAEVEAGLPQRRFNRPEELGALVAFLASEQASGITGTAVPVDGGSLLSLLS